MYNLENVKQTLFTDYRKNEGPESFSEWLKKEPYGGDVWARITREVFRIKGDTEPLTESEREAVFSDLTSGLEYTEIGTAPDFEDIIGEGVRRYNPVIACVEQYDPIRDVANGAWLVTFGWYEDEEIITYGNGGNSAAYITDGGELFLLPDLNGPYPLCLAQVPLYEWVRSDGRPAYIRNARPYAL